MIIILMGVAGSGKTTVGRRLAADLGCSFIDGDEFHTPQSIVKMRQGYGLTDTERESWLARIRTRIQTISAKKLPAVIACSALKESYRQFLEAGSEKVVYVFLKGEFSLIYDRLQKRKEHFATGSILASQFAALEAPENILTVDISLAPEDIVLIIERELGLRSF